ncbi:MAG: sugar ABC transporter permease [Clostridiales bacterium]|nr:sugar ABC transporter permease [Bacillota bacterium]NLL55261.1 sugar ABC transporter permease [Clostridiales bacterium]
MNSLTIAPKVKRSRAKKCIWMLILPAVVIRAATMLYPLCVTFYYSLLDYRVTKQLKVWGGIKNYEKFFRDPSIKATLSFTLRFTVFSMVFIVVLGILFALLLNVKFHGKPFLRSIALIPWAMPTIVIGIAMRWGFNGTYGFVNDLITRLIGQPFNYDWLANVGSAQFSVIFVDIWKNTPFFAIMVLAALQTIPSELYEAARVDGSGAIRSFRHITLPGISKTLGTMGLFFTLWRISSFDLVYAMTSGGPGSATSLIAYKLMLETVKTLNYGYASCIAVILFAVMVLITILSKGIMRVLATRGERR